MPRALFCVSPGNLEWKEYQDLPLAEGEVRVRPEHSSAKHGTEMAFFKGHFCAHGKWDLELSAFRSDQQVNPYPFPAGNMFVGPVIEVGPGVDGLAVGDRVYSYGGFRQTHKVPAKACQKLAPGTHWQSAVCVEPALFALGAVRDGNIRSGDVVAVFGLGAIGLIVVQLVKGVASRIIAIDPFPGRRAVAEKLGADITLDPRECDVGLEIRRLTGRVGADVCVEFSGNRQALQQALRGVAFGGTVVCGAFPAPYDAGLDFGAEAHSNIPNLVFSRACSDPNRDHPRWSLDRLERTCQALVASGRLRGELVVDKVVPFDDLLTEYPRIATDPQAAIKLGVSHE